MEKNPLEHVTLEFSLGMIDLYMGNDVIIGTKRGNIKLIIY